MSDGNVRFIRKGGRVIPIRSDIKRVAKGAAKDAIVAQVSGTVLNSTLLKHTPKAAFKHSLKYAAAWGGLSLAVRGLSTIYRRSKK